MSLFVSSALAEEATMLELSGQVVGWVFYGEDAQAVAASHEEVCDALRRVKAWRAQECGHPHDRGELFTVIRTDRGEYRELWYPFVCAVGTRVVQKLAGKCSSGSVEHWHHVAQVGSEGPFLCASCYFDQLEL